jgi:hypothetical protein
MKKYEKRGNMYLPSRITKILSKMNKSYIIYYDKGKIVSVATDNNNIKIEVSSKGYCINLKGSQIILNNLEALEPLLFKVNMLNKEYKNKNKFKMKDSFVEIFSENENTFAVEYNQGNVISIIMDKPKLFINKTSTGYLLNVNNKEIAVDNFSDIKKLLTKMHIIKSNKKIKIESNKKPKLLYKKDDMGFEQLKLNI